MWCCTPTAVHSGCVRTSRARAAPVHFVCVCACACPGAPSHVRARSQDVGSILVACAVLNHMRAVALDRNILYLAVGTFKDNNAGLAVALRPLLKELEELKTMNVAGSSVPVLQWLSGAGAHMHSGLCIRCALR